MYSLIFNFLGIFLSLKTTDRSLHLPHAALTLALTASSDPPSSLMVTPEYLNLFTYLRLVPWLSLMFTFVPLLLLTITSVFLMLTFSPLLSTLICQPGHLRCISSSVSVTTARSSTNSSSLGNPSSELFADDIYYCDKCYFHLINCINKYGSIKPWWTANNFVDIIPTSNIFGWASRFSVLQSLRPVDVQGLLIRKCNVWLN